MSGTKRSRRLRAKARRQRQAEHDRTAQTGWSRATVDVHPQDMLLAYLTQQWQLTTHSRVVPPALGDLVKIVAARAPKLLTAGEFVRPSLCRLAAATWVRPLKSWVPSGKASDARMRSLIDHLWVEFPVPRFLYRVFDLEPCVATDRLIRFFRHVASGGSAYKAVKAKFLPVPFTKRMTHLFMQARAGDTIVEAVRRAQVVSFDGSAQLLSRLLGTRLGRELQDDEAFWMTVIQWFCQQATAPVASEQIGPLVDFIAHLRTMHPNFAIAGRSPLALLERMGRWRQHRAQTEKLVGTVFQPSGLKAGHWHIRRRVGGNATRECWTIDEVLTSKDLAEEGRAMRHCAYSRGPFIESGNASLWSVRLGGERAVTVEVARQTRRIVQVRGAFNRFASLTELAQLRRWASMNALEVGNNL